MASSAEFSPPNATLASTHPRFDIPCYQPPLQRPPAWIGPTPFNEGYRTEAIPDVF